MGCRQGNGAHIPLQPVNSSVMCPKEAMIISKYERSIRTLHNSMLAVNRNPENREAALELQMLILRKIKYVERRIRILRNHRQKIRLQLKGMNAKSLSKKESATLKDSIRRCDSAKREYQFLLSLLRTFCDALVFTYFDKWDIKPLAFRPSPGYFSGKVGLKYELKILKTLFSKGQVAILNDLTNCLRYGDITTPSRFGPLPIEVKSGNGSNYRGRSQIERIQHVRDYLDTDRTNSLYGIEGEIVRFAAESEEVNYIKNISALLKHALVKGAATTAPEPGLVYAAHMSDKGWDATEFMNLLLIKTKHFGGKPLTICLNEDKLGNLVYLPRPLAIRDETAFWLYLCDKLQIFVIMDTGYINDYFSKNDLQCNWLLDSDYMFDISPIGVNPENDRLICSSPFFLRIAYEFLSLDWFLQTLRTHRKHTSELMKGDT